MKSLTETAFTILIALAIIAGCFYFYQSSLKSRIEQSFAKLPR